MYSLIPLLVLLCFGQTYCQIDNVLGYWQSTCKGTPFMYYPLSTYSNCITHQNNTYQNQCNNGSPETYLCSSNSTCQNCTTPDYLPSVCTLNYPSLYTKRICKYNTYYYPNNISVSLSELNNVQCNDYGKVQYIPTEGCLEDYYVIKCFNGYLTNTTYEFPGCLGNVVSIKHIDYNQIVCIPLSNGLFFKVNQCNGFINTSSGLLTRLTHIVWIVGVIAWIWL